MAKEGEGQMISRMRLIFCLSSFEYRVAGSDGPWCSVRVVSIELVDGGYYTRFISISLGKLPMYYLLMALLSLL
jgi:hypothetical protein